MTFTFVSAFMNSLTLLPVRAIGLKKDRRDRTRSLAVTGFINKDPSQIPIKLEREVMQRRNQTNLNVLNFDQIYDQQKRRM